MRLLTLHRLEDGSIGVVPEIGGLLNGEIIDAGLLTRLHSTTTLIFGDTTILVSLPSYDLCVQLFVMPHGGELHICRPNTPTRVLPLAARRLTLLDELNAHGSIEDEPLIERLWSNKVVRTRLDLNQLVYRTRQDLSRAGLDAEISIIRHPRGGVTTLRLSQGTRIEGVSGQPK